MGSRPVTHLPCIQVLGCADLFSFPDSEIVRAEETIGSEYSKNSNTECEEFSSGHGVRILSSEFTHCIAWARISFLLTRIVFHY